MAKLPPNVPIIGSSLDYQQCNNCGLMIGKNQYGLPVLNTRTGNYEYYHDSYIGCRDAQAAQNARRRVVLNRLGRGIREILFAEPQDYTIEMELADE